MVGSVQRKILQIGLLAPSRGRYNVSTRHARWHCHDKKSKSTVHLKSRLWCLWIGLPKRASSAQYHQNFYLTWIGGRAHLHSHPIAQPVQQVVQFYRTPYKAEPPRLGPGAHKVKLNFSRAIFFSQPTDPSNKESNFFPVWPKNDRRRLPGSEKFVSNFRLSSKLS